MATTAGSPNSSIRKFHFFNGDKSTQPASSCGRMTSAARSIASRSLLPRRELRDVLFQCHPSTIAAGRFSAQSRTHSRSDWARAATHRILARSLGSKASLSCDRDNPGSSIAANSSRQPSSPTPALQAGSRRPEASSALATAPQASSSLSSAARAPRRFISPIAAADCASAA